jgi:DNA-binding NtrC family response regulator
MASLLDHPWRGNVRELANTLERAVIVARGGRSLEFSDLLHTSGAVVSGATPGAETFDDGARRTIAVALRACAGRIYGKDGAAARLGMAPSTLQGKMRKLRMKRRDFLGESR